MRILFSLILSIVCTTLSWATDKPAAAAIAPAQGCAAALSGDALFDPVVDLDDEFPILKKRAEVLRREGFAQLLRTRTRDKVPTPAALHILENIRIGFTRYGGLVTSNYIKEFHRAQAQLEQYEDILQEGGVLDLREFNEWATRASFFLTDDEKIMAQLAEYFDEETEINTATWGWKKLLKKHRIRSVVSLSAMPTAVAFHPESVLYMLSRGYLTWEIPKEPRNVDGLQSKSDPFHVADHDGDHVGYLTRYRTILGRRNRQMFYDYLLGYINRPQQTLRQRELVIYLIYKCLFENGQPFKRSSFSIFFDQPDLVRDLKHFFWLDTPSERYHELSYLVASLNDPNHFGSALIHQRPVTREELERIVREFELWLKAGR